MAVFQGICECTQCNKQIKWQYQLAQLMSSGRFDVDTNAPDTVGIMSINRIHDNLYEITVQCRKCDNIMEFDYLDHMEYEKKGYRI